MKYLRFFSLALFLCLCTTAFAQPNIGEKINEFQLQATDGRSYGVNHSSNKVSVLFFVGYNWGTCIGAGPAFESQVHQPNSSKAGVQILTLDRYDGNPAQVQSYITLSRVTTPLLKNASGVSRDLGTRNEDILVIDQGGIIRLKTTAIATGSHDQINAQIDALLNKTPVISLSLRDLYFGRTLEVGQSKTVELKIENTGAGPLEITGYKAPEGITMEPSTLTIAPGESKTVQITLTPTQPGTFSGTITLQHGEQSVGTLEIPVLDLTIEAAQLPIISLIQENLSLGEIEVGQEVTTTFTITNSGAGPLTITDIQSNIAGITLSETQLTVPPGQSQDITVTFNPPAEGPITGSIDVFSDDPEKASISLSITGSAIFIPAPRTDFDGSGTIDFSDFLRFVGAFGTANTTFDLDGSGSVDFSDFLIFVSNFGKTIN